jgi:hypothetical protein
MPFGKLTARTAGAPRAPRLQEVNRGWSESPFVAGNVGALSPEARDLLDRIFVVDPARRITVAQIMRHPWCARRQRAALIMGIPERSRPGAEHPCGARRSRPARPCTSRARKSGSALRQIAACMRCAAGRYERTRGAHKPARGARGGGGAPGTPSRWRRSTRRRRTRWRASKRRWTRTWPAAAWTLPGLRRATARWTSSWPPRPSRPSQVIWNVEAARGAAWCAGACGLRVEPPPWPERPYACFN